MGPLLGRELWGRRERAQIKFEKKEVNKFSEEGKERELVLFAVRCRILGTDWSVF